jgi:hypothetical protein
VTRAGLLVAAVSKTGLETTYGYDGLGRFQTLAWSNAAQDHASASYGYAADSDRVAGYSVTNPATGLRFEAPAPWNRNATWWRR